MKKYWLRDTYWFFFIPEEEEEEPADYVPASPDYSPIIPLPE